MKRRIAGLVAVLSVLVVSLSAAVGVHAATPAATEITGVVTENNTQAVAGANVTATCNGHTAYDTSDTNGAYRVSFFAGDCAFGAIVKVVAMKGGMSGVAVNSVQGYTTKLNLAIINVAIPEYGVIGAVSALAAGAGMLAFTRRRQLQRQL